MKIVSALLLIFSFLFAACTRSPSMTPPAISQSPVIAQAETQQPLPTFTLPPTQTAIPTNTLTSIPTQSSSDYCQRLLINYRPSPGYQTYCDVDYGFAFDYPQGWKITYIAGAPDTANPIQARKAQRFEAPDMSNYIRVDTFFNPKTLTLLDQVHNWMGYSDREFPNNDYPSLSLGGKKAYAVLNCWQQDYSAVYLFFQPNQYYTIMELKAISQAGMDTNWQIARTLQTPDSTADKNVIPQQLINDSYQLLNCNTIPRPTSPTATVGTIAFTSNMDGDLALYTMNSDGTALTRLTTEPMLIMHPTWSSDGKRIAFEACRGGSPSTDCPEGESFDVYTINADDSNLVNLTQNPAMDRYPTWSPSGLIAFSSDRSGTEEIYVMNSDGTRVEQISNGQTRNSEPKWSPDGKRLAYHCSDEQSTNICIQLYGSSEQVFKVIGTFPVWSQLSAAGDYLLAFHCWSQSYSDICISKPDGTEVINLTNNTGDDIDPSWSPDRQWIAFQSNMYGDIAIYKVCITCVEYIGFIRLTGIEYDANWPIWSPDGNWITYLSDSDLYIMGADGSDQRLLASDVLGPPTWQP